MRIAYAYDLEDAPGKTIVGVDATYLPSEITPPHTHKNGPIMVYVLSGQVRVGLNGEEPKIECAGDSHYEPADTHNTISENPSRTESCRFFFTEVLDTAIWKAQGMEALFKLD
ncbi:hypothetical protein N7452_007049 [Penicillium brevicompactum]|nr:hypothetical protein N7452_007049 [Penicillium brevicompactum]